MKINIPNSEIQEFLSGKTYTYPKYVTQLLVLANQNAQGTRPKVVGQMSDLIKEFDGSSLQEWKEWYLKTHPDAIENATQKVYEMISSLKDAINKIDRETVRKWIEEFVIVKTFSGLKFQEAILKELSTHFRKPYRLANPNEESRGIDGFIDDKPISIKPTTYKIMFGLSETIDVPIVFYEKRKNDIVIEFNEDDF